MGGSAARGLIYRGRPEKGCTDSTHGEIRTRSLVKRSSLRKKTSIRENNNKGMAEQRPSDRAVSKKLRRMEKSWKKEGEGV